MAEDPEANSKPEARGNAGVTEPALSRPRGPGGRYAPGNPGSPGRPLGGRPFSHRGFFRRLALPTKYRFLLPVIEGRVAQLANDKPDPTAGEIALLDLYRRAHGASLLLLVEAHERGYIHVDGDGSWNLHPGARELFRFAELERRILIDLGLDRRAKPVDPLQAVRDAVERANEPLAVEPAPDDPRVKADDRPIVEADDPAAEEPAE